MRLGKYWNQKDVEAIKTIEIIKPEVLKKENIAGEITDLQGLWVSSACYIVYGRYSEASDAAQWNQPYDIKNYLKKDFKHNSINNPVVEKVVREMLMIVHDIWTTYGETNGTLINENGEEVISYKRFFDQINVEIGTSLKSNNKKKERDTIKNAENRRYLATNILNSVNSRHSCFCEKRNLSLIFLFSFIENAFKSPKPIKT